MDYPAHVWEQLKNLTAEEIVRALKKDGWVKEKGSGAIHVYLGPDKKRVGIHYHPHKTYGPKLLKGLIEDIGWTESDFERLKLIKQR
jgi:predicted RNA binding protein YcfA (HicA-like mRNA interferase family)